MLPKKNKTIRHDDDGLYVYKKWNLRDVSKTTVHRNDCLIYSRGLREDERYFFILLLILLSLNLSEIYKHRIYLHGGINYVFTCFGGNLGHEFG